MEVLEGIKDRVVVEVAESLAGRSDEEILKFFRRV